MEEEHEKITSLRGRRKKSSVGISCCFSGISHHQRRASFDAFNYSSSSPISHPSPRRPSHSQSSWFKSKTNDLPEIKGKCRSFISRMARHRRHSSADFSYDPLSYALNFDDDAASAEDDFRAMSFSNRLPASPPRRPTASFDHILPRTPEVRAAWKREEARGSSDDLRRGFEALSIRMNRSSGEVSSVSSSPKAAVEVRKSLEAEEVTSPVGVSSSREILVQLC